MNKFHYIRLTIEYMYISIHSSKISKQIVRIIYFCNTCIVNTGTGQKPPPDKAPLLPKPPSGKNPPQAKTPLLQKSPSGQNPPQTKIPLRYKKKTSCQPPSSPMNTMKVTNNHANKL